MNRKRLIIMLCILLCWMVLIFGFSAQTSVSSASLSRAVLRKLLALLPGWNTLSPVAQALRVRKVHHMFRKLGHFSEYTVLGVITALTGRLCFPADNRTQQRVRYFIVPACFALLYATAGHGCADRLCRRLSRHSADSGCGTDDRKAQGKETSRTVLSLIYIETPPIRFSAYRGRRVFSIRREPALPSRQPPPASCRRTSAREDTARICRH